MSYKLTHSFARRSSSLSSLSCLPKLGSAVYLAIGQQQQEEEEGEEGEEGDCNKKQEDSLTLPILNLLVTCEAGRHSETKFFLLNSRNSD